MLAPFSSNPSTTSENAPEALPQATEVAILPASFAQQRLWFVDQLEHDSSLYNIPLAVRLSGQLDLAVLEHALNEIINRHEMLRTTFAMVDGELMQSIAPELRLGLRTVGLEEVAEHERESELKRWAALEAHRSFDLVRGPLLRGELLRLGDQEHVLLLTMHHIVSDGWSMGVFFRELAVLYEAFMNGQPSPLEELPIQYADFAHWQRAQLRGEVLEEQLDYWRKQLAGAPPLLRLPTDRPRPRIQSFKGTYQTFALPAGLSKSLNTLSRNEGVTLFMTLLAAYQTLLYRYSGQAKIVVGTAIANRNQAEIEGLIGCFINMLVIAIDLSGDPSFRELLQRLREVLFGAYEHQDLPFEKLVDELQPVRSVGYSPLFQVGMLLQNAPMSELALPGLRLTPITVESETSKYDLMLLMRETKNGITGLLEYNTDLFDKSTIERMLRHFETLLESAVENPRQRLSALNLLSKEERRLLAGWNYTERDYPLAQSVHKLVEEQAERRPEAVAVVYGEVKLTYGDLNARANQLAHHLTALNVGPETLVGILMENSLEMAVALLGTLKAGGAYVPLDPGETSERLSATLKDPHLRLVLVQEHLRERVSSASVPVVCLDTDWEVIGGQSKAPLVSDIRVEHLACVIYGSDSANSQTGVMNTHRGICNQLRWLQDTLPLTEADRVLPGLPVDSCTLPWSFFWPLSTGACLVIARPGQHQDGAYLINLIATQDITTVQLSPATLQILLGTHGLEDCQSLRRVICGGEPLTLELQRTFFARSEAELHNVYGMKETSGVATHWLCERTGTEQHLPIGRPIANTQVHVLDRHLQPVPLGVPGELYIGGAGLMRGYSGRPELTAERLVPHPGSEKPGERLYRTLDVARHLPDGNLEFLGRAERQVERCGVRFFTDEIETVLHSHPGLRRAVVVSRENVPEDQRLVAYLESPLEPTPTISEIQNILKGHLPEYMLPVGLVTLKELPLKPNGKVDRGSLPASEPLWSEPAETYVTPRDRLEWQLAQFWEDILDLRPIGVASNFFNLGGSSFSVMNLMIQIQEQFGQELPLTAFFETPTIESIANILRGQDSSQVASPLVPIQANGSRRPFFCVHAVGGNALAYIELARSLGMDQPFYGLQARGLNGEHEPFQQIEGMAAYYLEALRAHQPQGPYMLGGWSLGGVVAFEMAQQLRRQGQEVPLLAMLDSWAPGTINSDLDPEKNATRLVANFILDLSNVTRELTPARAEEEYGALYNDLIKLDFDEQLDYVWKRARKANVIPPSAGVNQIGFLLQVYRSNFIAWTKYAPQSYPGPIVLFRASEVNEERVPDRTLGWEELSSTPVQVHFIPGNHYTILSKPHVQVLADGLRSCFDNATANN